MLTKEDLKLLSDMFDEKLKPIEQDVSQIKKDMNSMKEDIDLMKEDIDLVKEDIDLMKEDIDLVKEDLQEVKGMVNILSQWADAATEYHIHEIHFPLKDDEIVR